MSSAEKAFAPLLSMLQRAQKDLPEVLAQAAKDATIRAVEVTTDATPGKGDTGRGPYIGANTQSGGLKQHWATDSVIEPMGVALSGGTTFVTALKNNLYYASYVNDGHRLDRHFVPGLVINEETGTLEYNPDGKGGITVGTKTSYVKGEFMADKGVEEYKKALGEILNAKIMELMDE